MPGKSETVTHDLTLSSPDLFSTVDRQRVLPEVENSIEILKTLQNKAFHLHDMR